jgi:hypothetical protein
MARKLIIPLVIFSLLLSFSLCVGCNDSDDDPPDISDVAAVDVTETSAAITWTTDEPATSQVEYGTTMDYDASSSPDTQLSTSHEVTLTGLESDTTYHYRVRSTDDSDNDAVSGDKTFTTPDTTPPVISDVTVTDISAASANITWNTDEPATSQVEYGLTQACELGTIEDEALATSHSLTIEGLDEGTIYYYRLHSTDSLGNTATSEVLTLTTADDVVDLIEEGMIETRAEGVGIKELKLEARRLVDQLVTVYVPVGTYFVSGSASTQDMVSRESHTFVLDTDEWVSDKIPVACSNRSRAIPGSGDSFEIHRSPHQEELAELMPRLAEADVDFEVEQAAIWIVTDDADYSDLGILISGFFGPRLIKEKEAAQAMRIVHEAGIDITQKAIWQDRETIVAGLNDESLKEWISQLESTIPTSMTVHFIDGRPR